MKENRRSSVSGAVLNCVIQKKNNNNITDREENKKSVRVNISWIRVQGTRLTYERRTVMRQLLPFTPATIFVCELGP